MSQPPVGPPPEGPRLTKGQPYPPVAHQQTAAMPALPAEQPSAPRREKKPLYQRSWFIVVVVIAALAVIGSALGHKGDDTSTTAASSSATSTSTATSSAPSVAAQPSVLVSPAPAPVVAPSTVAPPVATQVVVDFAMPDFVGMDLQSAQNLVQANGVFLSLSHDLLGSRQQVLDSNWVVCDQNIPVGRRVTGDAEGRIDFGVVKRTESCP